MASGTVTMAAMSPLWLANCIRPSSLIIIYIAPAEQHLQIINVAMAAGTVGMDRMSLVVMILPTTILHKILAGKLKKKE